jgi:mono/diheme cytochrome c family protein
MLGPITPKRPAPRLAPPLLALLALLLLTAARAPLAAPAPGPGATPDAADPAPRPRLQREPTRGALLYETHCVACHDSQRHWRDQRLARDWPSLLAQVREWQARAILHWSNADIVEVARHLNDTIYRFPRPLAAREPTVAARESMVAAQEPTVVVRAPTPAR